MPVVAISLAVCALCCHNGRMTEPTSPNLSAASPNGRNPGLRLPQGLMLKLLILLIIFLAALGVGVRLWYGPAVPVHVVQQEALQQSVVSTGRVGSLSRVAVGSLVLGTLTEVTVREGARVRRKSFRLVLHDVNSVLSVCLSVRVCASVCVCVCARAHTHARASACVCESVSVCVHRERTERRYLGRFASCFLRSRTSPS
jgi:hypothetical protein